MRDGATSEAALGNVPKAALGNIDDAIATWIEAARDMGRPARSHRAIL